MKIDVLDYVGKIEDGVLVMVAITYQDEYYEGTFYYNTENIVALTVEERLEELLGSPIEEWSGYNDTMLQIIKKVVPIDEIINRLDPIQIEKYLSPTFQNFTYIPSGESVVATASTI